MKGNVYPKLEKTHLQILPSENIDLKKCNMGKSSIILLLIDRDQSHQCRQRPDKKKKLIKVIIKV